MRLGRERPRKRAADVAIVVGASGFNEAGARTPQKECLLMRRGAAAFWLQ